MPTELEFIGLSFSLPLQLSMEEIEELYFQFLSYILILPFILRSVTESTTRGVSVP